MTEPILRRIRYLIMRSRLQLRFRDLVLSTGRKTVWVYREDLARRYLSGEGIEIGALTMPLRVPFDVRVRYVDRLSRQDLLHVQGPMLRSVGVDPEVMPEVDVVDDAARLSRFSDCSVDFVIANHVLEHLEDPILALENMLRVIRPGGILFLILPDARYTFDAPRPRTTVQHLVRDHREGAAVSQQEHYREWARMGWLSPESVAPESADEDARHHFHVWELKDFLALLLALELPGELQHAQAYLKEFAVILRRY